MATEQEAQAKIRDSLVALEGAYQALLKSGKLIAVQLANSVAKCVEIKEYNLLMMSTYNQQLGWLQAMQDAGMSGIPVTPPFPTLFAVQGIAGEDALMIDCSKLPNFVGPDKIKIVTDGTQIFGGSMPEWRSFQHGELGVIWFVVAGVTLVLGAGAVWTVLDTNATARKLSAGKAKHLERKAAILEKNTEARALCNERCITAIIDPGSHASIQKCASKCDELHPKIPDAFWSDGTPKESGGIVKTVGWIAILAAVSIGGAVVYKRYKARKELEPGRPSRPDRSSRSDRPSRSLMPRRSAKIIDAELVD